jgi:hypothetical protein
MTPRQRAMVPRQRAMVLRPRPMTGGQRAMVLRQRAMVLRTRPMVLRQRAMAPRIRPMVPRQRPIIRGQRAMILRQRPMTGRQRPIIGGKCAVVQGQRAEAAGQRLELTSLPSHLAVHLLKRTGILNIISQKQCTLGAMGMCESCNCDLESYNARYGRVHHFCARLPRDLQTQTAPKDEVSVAPAVLYHFDVHFLHRAVSTIRTD